jgi:hypothetical protein
VTTLLLSLLLALPEYDSARDELATQRLVLSKLRDPIKARVEARKVLLDYLDQRAFPAWEGTAWNFYGTTTTPREGTIACGYFVTTVLEQAGFRIERVVLAKQASAFIVSTIARGTRVEWLRPADGAAALATIRAHFGDGLYVVGFDFHVGFLRIDGERAVFCHSSYLAPATVTCEDPLAAGAFVSRVYVVGDALNDAVLDDWLHARVIASQLPRRR